MKKIVVIILLTLIAIKGISQERTFFASDKSLFWVPLSFSGELRSFAHYRNQQISREFISDTQSSTRFSVGGLVKSKSYIWHKNFLLVDVEAEYNPDIIKENFIVIPDQAETRTMKRLNLKTTLFNNKVLTLNTTTDLSQTYSNRENITNIKTNRKQFSSLLSFSNKILPFSINFNKTNWTQEELEKSFSNQEDSVVRVSDMDQLNLSIRASKSFYSMDKHDLVLSHDEYLYRDNNFSQTQTISDIATLNDNFYFDQNKKYNLRSRISFRNQKGTVNYNRFQIDENVLLKLPYRFNFQTNYNCNKFNQEFQNSKAHNVKGLLSHKLYLSLNTNVFYEYRNIKHTVFEETYNILGTNIYYTKKIPLKGRLTLTYNYRRQDFNTITQAADVQVINENHTLTDGEIEMLDRPYINISTIEIRDITSSIIYQESLDYIVIERNNYVEIQRIPGGQIPNGTSILVDYIVSQPDSYGYVSNLNRFSGKIMLFNNLVEAFFTVNNQNFVNLQEADMLMLNYYTQYRYGASFDVKFATAGIEFDNYYSSIMPYKMTWYFATLYKNINERVLVSMNGSIRNYHLINEETDQLFSDISGKVAYRIFDLTKACVNIGYRKQIGTGIDLDLFTTKVEIISQLRKLFLTIGYEKYNKNYIGNINNYNGVYFKLIRKF